MELWIWITLVAATTQTLRSAGQKQMKSVMGDFGASYIRFSYALPFAAIWLYVVVTATGQPVPQTNFDFWLWVSIGGLMQVIFTVLLITLLITAILPLAQPFPKQRCCRRRFLKR